MSKSTIEIGAKGYWRHMRTYVLNSMRLRVQKAISLGTKDEKLAEKMALRVEMVWADETAVDPNGKKVWSEQGLTKLDAILNPPEEADSIPQSLPIPTVEPMVVPVRPRPVNAGITFHQMLDKWVAWQFVRTTPEARKLTDKKRISERHAEDSRNRVASFKHHIPNRLLKAVDNFALKEMWEIVANRPARRGQVFHHRTKGTHSEQNMKRISVATVQNWLMSLQQPVIRV